MDQPKTSICDIHGPFATELRGLKCPKCLEEALEKRDREEAEQEATYQMDRAAIPRCFRFKFLEDFIADTPAQKAVLSVVEDYLIRFPEHYSAARCLVLCGNTGTGKTMLACAILQKLIRDMALSGKKPPPIGWRSKDGYSVRYTTAMEYIRRVRDSWSSKQETATSVIERFKVDLLVLDEVGAHAGTDAERALLFELLDLRYQAQLPTIVITNCDREGLTAVLGERSVDRLRIHGGLACAFNWESWRSR